MPLFEYACTACQRRFETLVRGTEAPSCPSCQSSALERQFSAFAAHTGQGAAATRMPSAGGCGQCGDPRGPGACSMN